MEGAIGNPLTSGLYQHFVDWGPGRIQIMPSQQVRGSLGKATRSIVLLNRQRHTHTFSLTNMTACQSCTSVHIPREEAFYLFRSHVPRGTNKRVLPPATTNEIFTQRSCGPTTSWSRIPSVHLDELSSNVHKRYDQGKNLECTLSSRWFMARHLVCIHCSITMSNPIVPPSRLRESHDHNFSALWKRLCWRRVRQQAGSIEINRIECGASPG